MRVSLMHFARIRVALQYAPRLSHPVDIPFSRGCDELVPFGQQFGQDRKVPDRIARTGMRIAIENVCRRVPAKILLKLGPRFGHDPPARVDVTGTIEARQWKG